MITAVLISTEFTKKVVVKYTLFETPILTIGGHTTENQFRIFIDEIFDLELDVLLVDVIEY